MKNNESQVGISITIVGLTIGMILFFTLTGMPDLNREFSVGVLLLSLGFVSPMTYVAYRALFKFNVRDSVTETLCIAVAMIFSVTFMLLVQ